MRRAIKIEDSQIVIKGLTYKKGNAENNRKIAEILMQEQKGFCAYTDEPLRRTDSSDIEHFNPTIKGMETDDYYNWFLVKHQWNKEKGVRWGDFQPILKPMAEDFETRVVYIDGDYLTNDSKDIEAKNVISLLNLGDLALADERKKYIKRKHEEIEIFKESALDFFTNIIDNGGKISYPRAIKEEFGIDIWAMVK
jgi:hypothetical protein